MRDEEDPIPSGDDAPRTGRGISRRRFVELASAGGAAALSLGSTASAAVRRRSATETAPGPGTQPSGLPARQHAWDAALRRDAAANAVAPRHQRLVFLDLAAPPTAAAARTLEAALRTLERRYVWGPAGLLFCLGWGPTYFESVLGRPSPVPAAVPLAPGERPAIDRYVACLHLAADDAGRLAEVEAALLHGRRLAGADGPLDLRAVLRARETRTGFVGAGLPSAHQRVAGIPPGRPVSESSPLFMGFSSARRRNQASEDAVTIEQGPFAGGTTMHVSAIDLELAGWYRRLSERARVARMFAPQLTVADAQRLTSDAASDPGLVDQAAARYGMVGHAQAAAVARRGGRPLILRRDFNTADRDRAGVHFVALQRTIEDFIATRAAVNAPWAQARNPQITQTAHNGINEYMTVRRRGNYLVPSRADRAFPLLETTRPVSGG